MCLNEEPLSSLSTATVIVSPTCEITCFEQEKVAAIRKTLARDEKQLGELAELYKLLGNATRPKILLALADGWRCAMTGRWFTTACTARDC